MTWYAYLDGVTEELEATSREKAHEKAQEWARDGEWDTLEDDGETLTIKGFHGYVGVYEDEDEMEDVEFEVEPEDDPEKFGWNCISEEGHHFVPYRTRSTGGTALQLGSQCDRCGLLREEHTPGSQRNPGEGDTIIYCRSDHFYVEEPPLKLAAKKVVSKDFRDKNLLDPEEEVVLCADGSLIEISTSTLLFEEDPELKDRYWELKG